MGLVNYIKQVRLHGKHYSWKFTVIIEQNNHFRGSHQRCSIKKLLLKISQYLQKNTCVEVFFNEVPGLLKKRH